nr:hypothetical protein [Mucilaginibacter sp. X5P1]
MLRNEASIILATGNRLQIERGQVLRYQNDSYL